MQLDDASSQMGESLFVLIMVGDMRSALQELHRIENLGEQHTRRHCDYCSRPTEYGMRRCGCACASVPYGNQASVWKSGKSLSQHMVCRIQS